MMVLIALVLAAIGGVWNAMRKTRASRRSRDQGADIRIDQRQRVSVGIEQRAGAGAVDVGRLVPHEVEILLAGLRQIGVIALIVVADVLAPGVDFVEAVLAAGGKVEIAERPRPQIAVFVELRQTALALEDVPAIGWGSLRKPRPPNSMKPCVHQGVSTTAAAGALTGISASAASAPGMTGAMPSKRAPVAHERSTPDRDFILAPQGS